MQSQSGLRQAPKGLGKRNLHKPAENSPKGKSRIGHMRWRRPPHPKEGKTGDHQYPRGNPTPLQKTANASPRAGETAVNRRSGQDHAEVTPMKERPEVGGRKPDP